MNKIFRGCSVAGITTTAVAVALTPYGVFFACYVGVICGAVAGAIFYAPGAFIRGVLPFFREFVGTFKEPVTQVAWVLTLLLEGVYIRFMATVLFDRDEPISFVLVPLMGLALGVLFFVMFAAAIDALWLSGFDAARRLLPGRYNIGKTKFAAWNVALAAVVGLVVVVARFFRHPLRALAGWLRAVGGALRDMLWELNPINLFALIHTLPRLTCAVDGPVGGLVAYFWLGRDASLLERPLVALVGGVLGAVIGGIGYMFVTRTQEA